LCARKKLLLLIDGVQCGHFRTGRFKVSAHPGKILPIRKLRILPDGVAMAKSWADGFPIGAFWARRALRGLAGRRFAPGTLSGGGPLGLRRCFKGAGSHPNATHLAPMRAAVGDFLLAELSRLTGPVSAVLRQVRVWA